MEQRPDKPVRLSSVLADGSKSKILARDIAESLGMLPPQALDLEEAILGALLLERNALIDVVSFLKAEHFYSEAHKIIYEAILDLFRLSLPIDMRTVVDQLRKNGKLELIEGAYKIAELTSKVSSAANIEYHAHIIIEMSMKRDLIRMSSRIQKDAFDDTNDVFEMMQACSNMLQQIMDNAIAAKSEESIKAIAFAVLQEQTARQAGKKAGISTGFPVIDAILNGVNEPDLIVMGARPSMGKTSLAVQVAKNIADRGLPVGIFSLEMSKQQLIERMAISESEIDPDRVKKGILETFEFERYQAALGKLSALPMYIDDAAGLSIIELRAKAIRMKAKYGIRAIFIDYLQLIKGQKGGNRDQEIGDITRTLKIIAKELAIPVIVLSQLSRGVETRGGDKRPQLSDLRESGNIEQDADIVMFLYRPEYYKITVDEEGLPTLGICEIIIAKHRNGALGNVKLRFIGKYTKFKDLSETPQPIDQSMYMRQHSVDPSRSLPSQRSADDFEQDQDTPF